MTRAEKFIREYNNFNGKKISRKKLHDFHSRLKKEIDAKRIDAHVQYGPELLAIEKRIIRALPQAAPKVKVVCDNPVKIKPRRPPNVIVTQTAQGEEVIKTKGKVAHYHREDLTMLYGARKKKKRKKIKPSKIVKPEQPPAPTPAPDKKPEAQKKPKHVHLNGVVDASQLGSLQFSKIELDGKYKDDFLKVNGDTQMMIWGSPGSGKTVYTLEFAQYLAEKQNLQVLYVANEEWGRSTFAEKIDRFKIGHANLKFVESLASLKDAGATVDDFDVIFFDSVNSMGMTLDDYRKFAKENRGIIKVLIVQSTKDGDFRGGKDWEHEVDIAGEVKNRKIILRKNRLDEDFTKKSDKLLIEEQVKEGQRKKMIREKVQAKATEPKQDTV